MTIEAAVRHDESPSEAPTRLLRHLTIRELLSELARLEDLVRGQSMTPQVRALVREQARVVRELRRRRERLAAQLTHPSNRMPAPPPG